MNTLGKVTLEKVTAVELATVLEETIAQIVPRWSAQQPHLRERLLTMLTDESEKSPLPTMSFEEFLEWAKDIRAEWVGGEVHLMVPPSIRHQAIVVFLVTLLNLHVSARNLGMVFAAPVQMRLHQPPRGREPDVLFVAQANLGRFTQQYLDGPADLAVEVISPESIARDRGEKFYEYETAGIPEYWLIDPQREQAEFYLLDEQGHYQLALGGHTGQFASQVIPGLTVDVSWLWQEPLPPVWNTMQA